MSLSDFFTFLFGTSGDDTLSGTSGQDLILGRGGDDHILAGDGDDIVLGGSGDDRLATGGPGNDVVIAGSGSDFATGGQGDDLIRGGTGDDVVFGDAGVDLVRGGSGNDFLGGGAGDDVLIGGAGNDIDRGGTGADTFVFDLGRDEGTDIMRDFDPGQDSLNLVFAGLPLADNGAPGLADDIDALTQITDTGPGGDVRVAFATGTTLIFRDAGTGAIDSIADLVDDPMTQLISDPDLLF